jgi:cell division FtsZ-interacting protein ZapD
MTFRRFKDPRAVARYIARTTSGVPELPNRTNRSRGPLLITVPAVFLLAGMLFLVPSVSRANNGWSILTTILQTASRLGNQAQLLQQGQAQQQSYNQQVVAPRGNLEQTTSLLRSLQQAYSTAMSAVNGVSVHSASLPQTIALETSIYGGSVSAVQPNYVSVYGSQPAAHNVPAALANQSDMADAAANETLALAGRSDQFEATLLTVAGQLQQQAANTAPGTADMIQAQSAAMQLHSQAVQHRLLASLLRQHATLLAIKMSQVREAVRGHASSIQNMQQLLNGGH